MGFAAGHPLPAVASICAAYTLVGAAVYAVQSASRGGSGMSLGRQATQPLAACWACQ